MLFLPKAWWRWQKLYLLSRERQIPAAMLSALLAAGLAPGFIRSAPRPLIEGLFGLYLRLDARKIVRRYPPLRDVVPTMRFDFAVVTALQDRFDTFRSIRSETLLLSCRRSPTNLQEACARLAKIIPCSQRVEFDKLDHSGPWNHDKGSSPTFSLELCASSCRPELHEAA